MQAVLLLWMAVLAVGAEEWSFRDFLQGDWNLERSSAGQAFRAHYSFKEVNGDPARLEGKYHEEGEMGPTNEMVVRVLFSDASGRNGQFQLAKARAPEPAWTGDEDVPPVPQAQPEPKTAFEFAFRSQSDGRFQLSESNWQGKAGGVKQAKEGRKGGKQGREATEGGKGAMASKASTQIDPMAPALILEQHPHVRAERLVLSRVCGATYTTRSGG